MDEKLAKSAGSSDQAIVFQLLETYCAEKGLRLTAGDPYGHAGLIEGPLGEKRFFKGCRFDINSYGAAEIAKDKAYACRFLERAGLATPASLFVPAESFGAGAELSVDVHRFADATGYPVFVKPNEGQEGRDVVKAATSGELLTALQELSTRHPALLVQEAVPGTDLRVLVLDGEILLAFKRFKPAVTGDGSRSVADLINDQTKLDKSDPGIPVELAQQGLTLDTVPELGQTASLLPVCNLSSGGTAHLITSSLTPGLVSTALRAAEALHLRYAGIDLIVPDEHSGDKAAVVLEINAAPGLSNLYRQGQVEAEAATSTYRKVFEAMLMF
ncbi:ATP-grasp domain-containing protein [uncultured Roseibium sp.]|uniref:ATP-grasp domain-containing protein n=1 Tax=uncultured Roseibium sp. TaxID=1936171 RepID=UPI0026246E8B|nr:ATP-grasp domain-containing protein [uncultured Roseibium sp.]